MSRFWLITHPDLPTFILDGWLLGIVSAEHAATIASGITGKSIDPKWHVHTAGETLGKVDR